MPNENSQEVEAASVPKPLRSVRDEMQAARVSVSEAARRSSCAANTWRLYSASREAVSEAVRVRCDATLAWIRSLAKAREAA
jgi:hypothetical protein